MKLSFSTLGCPGWPLEKVIESAKIYGYDGVEFRGIDGELDIRKLPEFSPDNIAQTRAMFEDAGIEVISVDSSASFSHKEGGKLQSSIDEARDYITLAKHLGAPIVLLGAPMVRVFGGHIPDGVIWADGVDQLAFHLSQLGDFAQESGVILALETHDSFLTGKAVSEVMKKTNHDAVKVIWDISNCYWTGEPLEETAEFLAPHIIHVHVKDSVFVDGEAKLVFTGEGDIPLQKSLEILKDMGYGGYLSYEWEKVWQPDLPEPDEAFPQYVEQMKEYLDELS
jgi:sugar phosphate isomerase/epimerase